MPEPPLLQDIHVLGERIRNGTVVELTELLDQLRTAVNHGVEPSHQVAMELNRLITDAHNRVQRITSETIHRAQSESSEFQRAKEALTLALILQRQQRDAKAAQQDAPSAGAPKSS